MLISVIMVLIIVVFLAVLSGLFLDLLPAILFNGLVIYFVALRIFSEIKKYPDRLYYYVIAVIIGALIMLWKNILPFWDFTTAFVLGFILAQLYFLYEKQSK